MKTLIKALTAVAFLSSGVALAQQEGAEGEETPAPSTPAPTQAAPAPPSNPGAPPGSVGPPPQGVAGAPAAEEPSFGQWTYTSQYGWVYLPYAQNYTYVADDGGLAWEYAWYPSWGWRWIEAPWVLGWGPRPYWGYWGYGHYSWYAHPWFRPGVYRGAYGYGYRGGYHGSAYGYHGGAGYHGGFHGAGPVHTAVPQARPLQGTGEPAHFAGHGVSHGGGGGFHGGGGGGRR